MMGFYKNFLGKISETGEPPVVKDDFKQRIDKRLEEIKANFAAKESLPKVSV